ncbi:MAG: type I 3-dehydroquinate dehydratase [Lachnospiraceae bacterium]|nr:type I 3-dehydroquinate dehydratase [Lachnospiraceae bacterium]
MFEVRNIIFGGGKPAVAVPITGRTEAEIRSEASCARGEADLIELRADAFDGIHDTMRFLALLTDVRGAFDGPILFTLRSEREGGRLIVDPEEYLDILRIAISSGCIDLIDIELGTEITAEAEEYGISTAQMLAEEAQSFGIRVVMSQHDFASTPNRIDIYSAMEKMRDSGADIAKGAYMPQAARDVDEVLAAGLRAKERLGIPTILISMGELGQMTRTYGEAFGSAVTFACLGGRASAPGQQDARELREILSARHDRMSRADTLFLIGFMGAGKTTTAKELGRICGRRVIEMDEEIEKRQGMSIPEIFERSGESYFRDIETHLIESLARENGCIVSCGGGAVLRARNTVLMKSIGKIVLLTASPETVYQRLLNEADTRPNLSGRFSTEGILQLQNARREYYEAAQDITVATDGRAVEDIARDILSRLNWCNSSDRLLL